MNSIASFGFKRWSIEFDKILPHLITELPTSNYCSPAAIGFASSGLVPNNFQAEKWLIVPVEPKSTIPTFMRSFIR